MSEVEKNETLEFWAGQFGDEYLERNRVNWLKRVPFWQSILDKTNAQSILEMGCNAAWNMQALRKVNSELAMTGIDINENALKEARASGFDVEVLPVHEVAEKFGHGVCDLAFSCGVLIHIPPENITPSMTAICNVSSQYVLAVEYESEEEQMVKYRGNVDRLWRRPFGQMYQKLGLDLVETGTVGPEDGFDNCRWWLLEKA